MHKLAEAYNGGAMGYDTQMFIVRIVFVTAALVAIYNAYSLHVEVFRSGTPLPIVSISK
jgi:hypothetical protein